MSPQQTQPTAGAPAEGSLLARAWQKVLWLIATLWREVAKFGTVGGVAFLIDTAVFLWLINGPMSDSHVKSKAVAVAVATLFSWVGNRYWTFRHRRTKTRTRELVMFAVMNLVGLAIQSGCVAFSYYVLGLRSTEASFISGSVVGLVLAMCFRFVAYKYWVFTDTAQPQGVPEKLGVEAEKAEAEAEQTEARLEAGRTEPEESQAPAEEPRQSAGEPGTPPGHRRR